MNYMESKLRKKKIKDPFSYSARWDSVGLDCSNCKYFKGPENWPDINKTIYCSKHSISLEIELGSSLYKEWEWFCKDFTNNPEDPAFPEAISELEYSYYYFG